MQFPSPRFQLYRLAQDPRSPFLGKDREKWINEAEITAAKNGADFNQAHVPVGADIPRLKELQLREIKACGKLGIPWIVFYALYNNDPEFSDLDTEHFRSLLDECRKNNVGIVIENIWTVCQDCPIWKTAELIHLVDRIGDKMV